MDAFLRILGPNLPPTDNGDHMRWKLSKNGDFDIQSFYNKLRGPLPIIFPWKGVWKVKAPGVFLYLCGLLFGMHGLGSRPLTLASDAAGRGDAGGTPLTACRASSYHVDSPTRADAAQIGLTRAVSAKTGETAEMAETPKSGQNSKKKKKKVQNAPFELNLKP